MRGDECGATAGLTARQSQRGRPRAASAQSRAAGTGCSRRRHHRQRQHSLGDAYASLLFSNGLDVVFVSRQRGHANLSITLEVYAHLFAQSDHAADARGALDADSSSVLVSVGIRRRRR